jgi:hypothetical protein
MYIQTQLGRLDDVCVGSRRLVITQALDDLNLRVIITNLLAMTLLSLQTTCGWSIWPSNLAARRRSLETFGPTPAYEVKIARG